MPLDAYCISRMDVDRDLMKRLGIHVAGVDLFIIRTAWWECHHQRFRDYVNSEALWDMIYTAICLCHGNSRLFNTDEYILHIAQPTGMGGKPIFRL